MLSRQALGAGATCHQREASQAGQRALVKQEIAGGWLKCVGASPGALRERPPAAGAHRLDRSAAPSRRRYLRGVHSPPLEKYRSTVSRCSAGTRLESGPASPTSPCTAIPEPAVTPAPEPRIADPPSDEVCTPCCPELEGSATPGLAPSRAAGSASASPPVDTSDSAGSSPVPTSRSEADAAPSSPVGSPASPVPAPAPCWALAESPSSCMPLAFAPGCDVSPGAPPSPGPG